MKKNATFKVMLACAGAVAASIFAAGCGPAGPPPPPPPAPNVIDVNLLYPTAPGFNVKYEEVSIANNTKPVTMTMSNNGILLAHGVMVHPSVFTVPAKDNLGQDYNLVFSEWIHSKPEHIKLWRFDILQFPVSFNNIKLNLDINAVLASPLELFNNANAVGHQLTIPSSDAKVTLAGLINSDVTYSGSVSFISKSSWVDDPAVRDGLATAAREIYHVNYDITVDLTSVKTQYENSTNELVRQIAAFIPPSININSNMFMVPGVGMIRKTTQINASTIAIPPINLGNYDYSAMDKDKDHWLDPVDLNDDDINSH